MWKERGRRTCFWKLFVLNVFFVYRVDANLKYLYICARIRQNANSKQFNIQSEYPCHVASKFADLCWIHFGLKFSLFLGSFRFESQIILDISIFMQMLLAQSSLILLFANIVNIHSHLHISNTSSLTPIFLVRYIKFGLSLPNGHHIFVILQKVNMCCFSEDSMCKVKRYKYLILNRLGYITMYHHKILVDVS